MISVDFTMANTKVVRTIIGIIGNVLSTLISLSQMPALIQIYQTKSVEDYLPCRHVLLLLKHSLWVLYGLPRTRKSTLLSLFHVLILVAIFYVTSLFGVESFSFRHTFIGVVCNIFTPMIDVLIAIFPLDVPVWLSLADFIKAGIWIAFSSISKVDIYLLISNGLGLLVCAIDFLCRNLCEHSTTPTVNVVAV